MDNQNPTPASGGAQGGFAAASNNSAPYGASQAQPGGPGPAPSFQPAYGAPNGQPGAPAGVAIAPAAYPERDDTYHRIPAEYTVPEEHRRPYGDATSDFRAPATTTPSAPSAPAWEPWRSPSTPGWLWACVPSR